MGHLQCFWRAPTDNDRGGGYSYCARWRNAGINQLQTVQDSFPTVTQTAGPDGSFPCIAVTLTMTPCGSNRGGVAGISVTLTHDIQTNGTVDLNMVATASVVTPDTSCWPAHALLK